MKTKILNVLNFIRLIDEHGLLSVTNLCVWVIVFKLAIAKEINFADVAALFAAISAYNFKRWHQSNSKKEKAPIDKLSELETKLDTLSVRMGLKQ